MVPLDTTPRTHVLFFDMQEIANLNNLRRTVSEAKKHPLNPVLPLGGIDEWDSVEAAPWVGRTVLYDDQDRLFKAWYVGINVNFTDHYVPYPPGSPRGEGRLLPLQEYSTGYATSHDGVRWDKPKLGLYEFEGSKENNICFRGWGSVLKDLAEEDPAKRYKFISKGPDRDQYGIYRDVRLDFSSDGVHWNKGPKIEMPQWEGKGPDIVAFYRDDQDTDSQRRYKLVWQTKDKANKPGPGSGRVKNLAWSSDAVTWTACPANPFLTPNDSTEQENHFLGIHPYRGWSIMLYEYGWWHPTPRAHSARRYNGLDLVMNGENAGCFDYCSDIRLAASRDGVDYTRIEPQQRVISRGEAGAWDAGLLVVSDKVAIKDDEIYLFYCGNGQECGGFMTDRRGSRASRMGFATLGIDRFTYLETCDGDSYGEALTTKIKVQDADQAELVINLSDTDPIRSWVEIDVLDADRNEPIAGYACDDCAIIDEDSLAAPVRWKGGQTLGGVSCQNIQLRFRIYGAAKLYSFWFSKLQVNR